jgi:hypothetical protein
VLRFFYCFVFLLSSLICSFSGYAQTSYRLSGKVLDSETNSPLAGVTVAASNGGTVNTDAEGNFLISLDAENTYSITKTLKPL